MKKRLFIFLLIFSFIFSPKISSAFHYVYVRTENRHGVTSEDDIGRSKIGDIVDIISDTQTPSDQEKSSYAIFKISGLSDDDIKLYRENWSGYAYRKYHIDPNRLSIINTGLREITFVKTLLTNSVVEKTEETLSSYKIGQRRYARFRWFRYLKNRITRKAFAETVSTINKTGEDYNTLILWEDDKDGDLVSDTRQETAHLYDDDGVLESYCEVDGSTTNSTYYMKISSPSGERHSGTDASGAELKNNYDADYVGAIRVWDEYVVIEWLILSAYMSLGQAGVVYLWTGAENCTVQNNIITGGTSGNNDLHGIWCANGSNNETHKVYNNIIYDVESDGIRNTVWSPNLIFQVYNNTVYGCGDVGIDEDGGCNFVLINNISDNNTTSDYNGSFDTDTDNLDTSDGVIFENEGGDNFHLDSTDTAAIDQGTDNGTEANIDIDGRDRDSEADTWDIGADEYVSVAGGTLVPYYYFQ